MSEAVSTEVIASKIIRVRGRSVILDKDLAILYGVSTSNLNKAVSRNLERFPQDFMFQLTGEEFNNLMFQIGTSSWGGTRKMPYVFTEQGVAMLSSVLRSKRAFAVNVQIMRAFVKLKELLMTHKELAEKIAILEKKYSEHDEKIQAIFEAIKELLKPTAIEEKRIIGFQK